jgi:hypothetical protein
MSFINHPGQLRPAPAAAPQKSSVWQRMLGPIADVRRTASEQIASDLIARNGGRLTDDVERQIAHYL